MEDRSRSVARVSLLLTALVLGALVSSQASAEPDRRADSIRFRSESLREQRNALEYWTRARMRQAEPMPLLSPKEAPGTVAQPLDQMLFGGSGDEVTIEGSARDADAGRELDMLPESLTSLEQASQSGEVTTPGEFPQRTHGKLFGHYGSVGDFVCSGTVVTSNNSNLVWTAGHCITLEGEWADSLVFVPGYFKQDANTPASEPYGRWASEQSGTPSQWSDGGNHAFDFGAMLMAPNAEGNEIQAVVGSRGIRFSAGRDHRYKAFGYPAEPPFNGNRSWMCESDYRGADPYHVEKGPRPMGIDCDMTAGSSGGGWIVEDPEVAAPDNGFLQSVNSYGRPIFEDTMLGPYLTSVAAGLYADASGSTPTPFPSQTDSPVDTHNRELVLNLRRHLVAKGTMTTDGHPACTHRAPVGIYRETRAGWVLVAEELTSLEGRYSIKVPDKRGRYLAYGVDGYVDDFNQCAETYSAPRRHRH